MGAKENIQIVKDFFGAVRGGDTSRLLAFVAEDIDWIIRAKTGRWLERIADMLELRSF